MDDLGCTRLQMRKIRRYLKDHGANVKLDDNDAETPSAPSAPATASPPPAVPAPRCVLCSPPPRRPAAAHTRKHTTQTAHAHTGTSRNTHTHPGTHARAPIHTCTLTLTHSLTRTRTNIHIDIQTWTSIPTRPTFPSLPFFRLPRHPHNRALFLSSPWR